MPAAKLVRILAVDPTSRGFGFVVLEGPDRLIDWGVKEVRSHAPAAVLRKIAELIDRYRPGALVVEDCSHPSSRRRARARSLIEALANLAHNKNLRAQRVSPATIRSALTANGAATKHDIAALLAQRFPELARSLPPRRKPWMSEHHAQAVFDAAALAATLIELRRR